MQITKSKNTLIKTIMLVLSVTLFPSFGLAHHSSSEFTNTRIELEGTLLQVSWRNPHPSLTFQLSNTGELWNIQIPGTIESLPAIGITASSFKIGQNVNIAGFASSRIENYLQGTHVLFSNGKEVILKQGLQPLWTQPTAIMNEVIITSDTIILEEPVTLAINYKLLIMLSIFAGLLSIYGIKSFKKKSLQASI